MKVIQLIKSILLTLLHNNNGEQVQLVKQLQHLVTKGIETQAEILDAQVEEDKVGKLYEVQLWVRLQKNDQTFIYTKTRTLLQWSKIPCKGQILKVRYFPHDLNSILLL